MYLLSPLAITTIDVNSILCVRVVVCSFFGAGLPKTISLSTLGAIGPWGLIKLWRCIKQSEAAGAVISPWWACDGQAGKSFLLPFFSPGKAGVPQGKRGGCVPVQMDVPGCPAFFPGPHGSRLAQPVLPGIYLSPQGKLSSRSNPHPWFLGDSSAFCDWRGLPVTDMEFAFLAICFFCTDHTGRELQGWGEFREGHDCCGRCQVNGHPCLSM